MVENETSTDQKADDNTVFIGNKPPMSYVPVVIAMLNTEGTHEVTLKARGNAISRAVDTAEIVRNRFLTDAQVTDIKIATEPITSTDGRTSNVSSMEIFLSLKK